VNKTFFRRLPVFVVDDVATSMGTKQDLLKTVEQEAKASKISVRLVGIGIAIDREQTTAVHDSQGRVFRGRKERMRFRILWLPPASLFTPWPGSGR